MFMASHIGVPKAMRSLLHHGQQQVTSESAATWSSCAMNVCWYCGAFAEEHPTTTTQPWPTGLPWHGYMLPSMHGFVRGRGRGIVASRGATGQASLLVPLVPFCSSCKGADQRVDKVLRTPPPPTSHALLTRTRGACSQACVSLWVREAQYGITLLHILGLLWQALPCLH